ncbi:aldo/keto reductase, partial [Enterobacter hormaechei]|nr:aldo/keto reductase [Enterobacter hormaechei]
RPDPLMDADDTAAGLQAVVKAGKVRAVGVSNFTPPQIDLLASRLPFPVVTNQIEMSVTATEPLTDGSLDHAQRLRYAPMIWSPLGGGSLFTGTGEQEQRVRAALQAVGGELGVDDIAAVAIAWLLRHPARLV